MSHIKSTQKVTFLVFARQVSGCGWNQSSSSYSQVIVGLPCACVISLLGTLALTSPVLCSHSSLGRASLRNGLWNSPITVFLCFK